MDRFEIGAYMISESLVFSANLSVKHLMHKNRKNINKIDKINRPLMHLKQSYSLSKQWREANPMKQINHEGGYIEIKHKEQN